ncbi:Putative palmitoyltransferase ZDHHC6 [Chelonia mydas]|uniref:Putative palmitoyltransferase ZDHHC6 n=1 Tax=Chelonia mydas TaxID=8469 RepID=M7CE05_CHEMY|nr:Putative palmitoyltransferase ZDHHC6 [Chelonia mydas]
MGALCSVIRFENLQELKRLCHWGPIIALGVIAICSTMAMIDAVMWYWPLDTTGGSVNFIMLINWTVMILYNYFNAMFIGPGYVPLGWKPISFGWSSVKIDMSAAKRDPLPIIPFGLSAFAASLFALGLALGTTIAVGMLFIIQAKDRIQYYKTGEIFIFPYDMGSKWKNFKQVFTWSGIPEGDGLEWPVRESCHQYTLTTALGAESENADRWRTEKYKHYQTPGGRSYGPWAGTRNRERAQVPPKPPNSWSDTGVDLDCGFTKTAKLRAVVKLQGAKMGKDWDLKGTYSDEAFRDRKIKN